MRLLNTYALKLREFAAKNTPLYAILSHTWDEEKSHFRIYSTCQLHERGKASTKFRSAVNKQYEMVLGGSGLIHAASTKAHRPNYQKQSTRRTKGTRTRLSVYAYLTDVKCQFPDIDEFESKNCRWFTRGWTLQELIAPLTIEFYASDWSEIGTKTTLEDWIASRTGIPPHILLSDSPSSCTVAQRMSWASDRVTTRVEDMAHCLLGIFNVNIPLLYGEGDRAFIRLQEEIMRKEEDYTIFLWSEPVLERFPTNSWKSTSGALPR